MSSFGTTSGITVEISAVLRAARSAAKRNVVACGSTTPLQNALAEPFSKDFRALLQ